MNLLTMMPLLTSMFTITPGVDEPRFQQCQQEPDAKVRLACYDALGRYRNAADGDTLTRQFQLQTDPMNGDLSVVQRIDSATIFRVSCLNMITHLRVTLVRPWDGLHVNTTVDGQPVAGGWFVRNNGQLLEFGRGLPAIDELRRWSQLHELVLTSDGGREIHVSLNGFGEALKPLRQQCRW